MLERFLSSIPIATAFFLVFHSTVEAGDLELAGKTELALDFRNGFAMVEAPTKSSFRHSYLFGMGVAAEYRLVNNHYLTLGVGYLRPLNKEDKGTEQIRVKNSMQLVDILVGYKHRFKYTDVWTGLGPSLSIVTTTTQLFDLGKATLDVTFAEDGVQQYRFPDKKIVSDETERGVNVGFTVGIGGALDVGQFIGIECDFLMLNLAAQYVRRGQRNEVYAWGGIGIVPTALRTKNN